MIESTIGVLHNIVFSQKSRKYPKTSRKKGRETPTSGHAQNILSVTSHTVAMLLPVMRNGTFCITTIVTRIIQSLYYAPAGRYNNAWMHSLKNSVKPEIVNRYDLWVLRHKIEGASVCK